MNWLLRTRAGLARLLAPESESFDELPMALVHLDERGLMCQGNRGWEALSGYQMIDCLWRDHGDFLHIEDRSLWQQGLQSLSGEPRSPWVANLRYLNQGGELHWVEVRVARRAAGGYVASLADISAQVPQRQLLHARHRSLNNLLDGLPLMVYRCRNNRHWSMEYVSAGCLELTGYSPEQLIDSHCLTFNSLIHPLDRELVWSRVQEGLRAAQAYAFDYRLLCADGQEKWVSERGRGIYSDLGEVLGLEGVVMARAKRERLPVALAHPAGF